MSKSKEEILGTVTKNRAVKIFESLGFQTAGSWDVSRLQKKITKLDTLIEGADLDAKTLKRVNEILRAQAKGRKVAVIDPEDAAGAKQRDKDINDAAKQEADRKTEKKANAGKKEKKEAKKKVKEDAASKKQEKRIAAKKTTEKKEKKPGVIMSMLEFVKTHGPVSEKKIHSLLKKRFPDKDPDSMGRSIPQVPRYLVKKKDMDVIGKDEKGRFFIKK